ncbi:MAG: long-chain fatty acid--CoA ligase, partial [Firmicutes bacterium]|nr:long-chain fatty acid--CoA ligase [Bacillota bacterium]
MEKIWLKSYEPTVPHSIDYPQISVYEKFKEIVKLYPENKAVSFFGREFTYRELLTMVDAFAVALQELGVKKDDRVALHLPNCTQFPIACYGAMAIGAIVVPCNAMYVARELAYQLKDSGATTIVTLTRFYKMVKEIQPQTALKNVIVANIKDYFPGGLRILYTLAKEKKEGDRAKIAPDDYSFTGLVKMNMGKKPAPVKVAAGDRALFMYTGGSTGVAKGAVLNHISALANVLQITKWCPDYKEGGEILLAALPFFHSYGMSLAMNLSLLTGGKVVMLPRFVVDDVLKTIDKEKPTLLHGVPTMYVALNNAPNLHKYNIRSIR